MSAITYTAKRSFEATGYAKAGVDISVAAADDSFNSVSTVLTGLLTGQWALVAGFANGVNNGWFHASGNSTATKIVQDTTSSLITEAAGPAVTITGYQRGLNQSYSMDVDLERADRSTEFVGSSQRALGGGGPEVLAQRDDVTFDITAGIILEAKIAQWREFLASVKAGEPFTMDLNGSVASPVDPHVYTLEGDKYTEQRLGPGAYQLGFRVLLIS